MTFLLPLRAVLLGGALVLPAVAGAAEINLYTSREPQLVQPLLDAFTAES